MAVMSPMGWSVVWGQLALPLKVPVPQQKGATDSSVAPTTDGVDSGEAKTFRTLYGV